MKRFVWAWLLVASALQAGERCRIVIRALGVKDKIVAVGQPFRSNHLAGNEATVELLPPVAGAGPDAAERGLILGSHGYGDLIVLADDGRVHVLRPSRIRLQNGSRLKLDPAEVRNDRYREPKTDAEKARLKAAEEALFKLIDNPPPWPVSDPLPTTGDPVERFMASNRNYQRMQKELGFFEMRRELLPVLARMARDQARLKKFLLERLAHDPDAKLREMIPGLLYELGLLENADVPAVVANPSPEYWRELLNLYLTSRTHRRIERLPLELIPVYGLLHPDVDVRSRAIDWLRVTADPHSFAPFENPAVFDALKQIRPRLSGHPADAADFALRQGRYAKKEVTATPAPVAAAAELNPIFARLLLDTCTDCAGFKDLPIERRNALAGMRADIQAGKNPNDLAPLKAEPWGNIHATWPEAAKPVDGEWRVWKVTGRDPETDFGHAMGDVDGYLDGWLGREMVRAVERDEIEVVVFAGDVARLRARVDGFDPKRLRKLPSPYGDWGIEKWYYDRPGKPIVFVTIPPIEQYAKHYVHLLHEAGAKSAMVILDEGSREAYKKDWTQTAGKLIAGLKEKPNRVVLGYAAQWKQALQNHPDWQLKGEEVVTVKQNGLELTGRLMTVVHRHDPEHPEKILLVTSAKTWWGEAARHLTEGLLDAAPSIRDVTFMGSAGSIGVNAAYPIAIPAQFHLPGSQVPIENSIALYKGGAQLITDPDGGEMPVHLYSGGAHGFSDSPAQQTRGLVTTQYQMQNVNSIDVESPLIAQLIAQRNMRQSDDKKVRFGAGYVLTDHPAGYFTYDIGASLSTIGDKHKAKARDRVVEFALDAMSQQHYQAMGIDKLIGQPDGPSFSFENTSRSGMWVYPSDRPPSWIRYRGSMRYFW